MNFVINEKRLFHLLRHFESIDENCQKHLIAKGYTLKDINDALKASGSLFSPSFCTSPCQLTASLSKLKHEILKLQENGFYAIHFSSNQIVGTNGLIPISKLSREEQNRILVQNRNGIQVKFIRNFKAPETKIGHIISKKYSDTDNYEIVTCFPGDLSPPFPEGIKDSKERSISELFWNNHVLIEQ